MESQEGAGILSRFQKKERIKREKFEDGYQRNLLLVIVFLLKAEENIITDTMRGIVSVMVSGSA